jgi:hypothetical protein
VSIAPQSKIYCKTRSTRPIPTRSPVVALDGVLAAEHICSPLISGCVWSSRSSRRGTTARLPLARLLDVLVFSEKSCTNFSMYGSEFQK